MGEAAGGPHKNPGEVDLLDLPRLITQLAGLERRTARGGRDSIDHGPGGHDDVANSVAGALARVVAPPRSMMDVLGDEDQDQVESDKRWRFYNQHPSLVGVR